MSGIENYVEPIDKIGFDFDWDEAKVWALKEPVTMMPIAELAWHLDYPFFREGKGEYNLKPRDVMTRPDSHAEDAERVMNADTSWPLDIMENNGQWLLLDGLHRLTKLAMSGATEVQVRIIPRSKIGEITK
jgi:hypothetical protein